MLCEVCYKDASLVCSACKETRYCSAECQQAAWKHHKIGCKIQQQLNVVNAEMAAKPRARPAKNRCTGCNERGRDFYSCDECGYRACESCESDSSNGTCYCADSNFGNKYCELEPKWYHGNGRGNSYNGDRHPEGYGDFPEEMYEAEERECNNCGKVTRVFKKEYCM